MTESPMSRFTRETLLAMVMSPHGITSPLDQAAAKAELDRREREEADAKDARDLEISRQVASATKSAARAAVLSAVAAGIAAIAALIAAGATVWQVLHQP